MNGDTNPQERREYFRIKNWMILNHQRIDSIDAIPETDNFTLDTTPRIELLQQLSQLNNENQTYISSLGSKQDPLGGYLINLNKKIDILTRFVLQSFDEEHQEMTEVDISGGGLRFSTKQGYQHNDFLKIELVLVPECVGILIYGQVVQCTKIKKRFETAVIFSKIRESDRDAIVRHIFKIQSQQLRNEKES